MPFLRNVADFAVSLIPNASTSEGLRYLQYLTCGLAGLYFFLHISLYMDNMVPHLGFAMELGTLFYLLFVPIKYEIRPLRLLKRRFFLHLILASGWLIQPSLLLLNPETDPSLLGDIHVLTDHVSKALNQRQIESILAEGGKVDEGFQGQNVYAYQLAAALQSEAYLSFFLIFFLLVEAVFVWMKYIELDNSEEGHLEREREEKEEQEEKDAADEKKEKPTSATSTSATTTTTTTTTTRSRSKKSSK
ncbi:hypothetical protein BGZ76_010119 [Entomortierella beljakovae]|nr:hypothetical protein BGZ76_010119 [Entomortierella beljakovae]